MLPVWRAALGMPLEGGNSKQETALLEYVQQYQYGRLRWMIFVDARPSCCIGSHASIVTGLLVEIEMLCLHLAVHLLT